MYHTIYRNERVHRAIDHAEAADAQQPLRALNGQQKRFLLPGTQAIPRACVKSVADRFQALRHILRQPAEQKCRQQNAQHTDESGQVGGAQATGLVSHEHERGQFNGAEQHLIENHSVHAIADNCCQTWKEKPEKNEKIQKKTFSKCKSPYSRISLWNRIWLARARRLSNGTVRSVDCTRARSSKSARAAPKSATIADT